LGARRGMEGTRLRGIGRQIPGGMRFDPYRGGLGISHDGAASPYRAPRPVRGLMVAVEGPTLSGAGGVSLHEVDSRNAPIGIHIESPARPRYGGYGPTYPARAESAEVAVGAHARAEAFYFLPPGSRARSDRLR